MNPSAGISRSSTNSVNYRRAGQHLYAGVVQDGPQPAVAGEDVLPVPGGRKMAPWLQTMSSWRMNTGMLVWPGTNVVLGDAVDALKRGRIPRGRPPRPTGTSPSRKPGCTQIRSSCSSPGRAQLGAVAGSSVLILVVSDQPLEVWQSILLAASKARPPHGAEGLGTISAGRSRPSHSACPCRWCGPGPAREWASLLYQEIVLRRHVEAAPGLILWLASAGSSPVRRRTSSQWRRTRCAGSDHLRRERQVVRHALSP